MGSKFLRPKTSDPMRRVGIGILFGFCGMFLQNLTEWVFRHLPLYYTFHVMLGTLMSLYYVRRQALNAARSVPENTDELAPTLAPVPAI